MASKFYFKVLISQEKMTIMEGYSHQIQTSFGTSTKYSEMRPAAIIKLSMSINTKNKWNYRMITSPSSLGSKGI